MTKQEMAEWLAEHILGGRFPEGRSLEGHWYIPNVDGLLTAEGLAAFIYSPNGFFAVWDALVKHKNKEIHPHALSRLTRAVLLGKDRYEAFYNAVFEALKIKEK